MIASRVFSIATRLLFTILLLTGFLKATTLVNAQALESFQFDNFTVGSPKIAGMPFPVTITAYDQGGQFLSTFNQSITLSDTTDTIYPTTTGNFSNGTWSGHIYITQATQNTAITASYNSAMGMSNPFIVEPDRRIKFLSIISGNNQTGIVGNQLPTALRMRVIDPYNNPISNIGVNFAITSVPPNSLSHSLSNTSSTSNVNGEAQTLLTLGRKSGTYIVSGTLTTGITNAVHFYETAVAAPLMSIDITPAVAVIPGGSFLPFLAQGYDQYANVVPLSSVLWSVQNGGGTIDSTGVFYAGTSLGTYLNTVRAVSGNIGSTASVTIVGSSGEGTATGSSPLPTPIQEPTPTPVPLQEGVLYDVQIDPGVISALRNIRIPIIAEGVDIFGNRVPGVTYDFQVEGGLGDLTRTGPGSALLTTGETGLGAIRVTATQGDITITQRLIGSIGNGINRRLVIQDIPSPQQVGVPFTISIAAKDSADNFVTDYEGPIVLADTTNTIDPATVQPSAEGIWYVQAVITLAHPEVTLTAAGDGMVGVSNIFEVIGSPSKDDVSFGFGLGGVGEVLGASISAIIDQLLLDKDLNKFTVFRYIGSGIAAGFGILGTSIGGGIMVSRGLEAIGRNPYAKGRLQVNLYASVVAFIIAAALAVFAAFLILK
jgi:F0F1-type ATP synthase membrane subunit c/vacuolar-type H+-ATPase subunit K